MAAFLCPNHVKLGVCNTRLQAIFLPYWSALTACVASKVTLDGINIPT